MIRRCRFFTIAAAFSLALAGAARGDNVTITAVGIHNNTLSSQTTGFAFGANRNTATISVVSDQGSFLSYCVDPTQVFGTGVFARDLVATYYTATQTSLLERLWFTSFAASSASKAAAAAFQYAVWEISQDGGVLDLSVGNVYINAGALLNDVTALLAAAQSAGPGTALYVLQNPLRQDLLMPVPEPGTWALLLAGLALVGVGARRRAPTVLALQFFSMRGIDAARSRSEVVSAPRAGSVARRLRSALNLSEI